MLRQKAPQLLLLPHLEPQGGGAEVRHKILHLKEGKENQLKTGTCISAFIAVAGRMDCLVHFMF